MHFARKPVSSGGGEEAGFRVMMQKRSITLKGHRTSIALEEEFWAALDRIAEEQKRTVPSLVYEIDRNRLGRSPAPGLASAIRVYVLNRLSEKP